MGKSVQFAIEKNQMPAKKLPMDEQSKQFIDAARELGCDEDPAHFEDKLKKVAAHKPVPETKGPGPDAATGEPEKPRASSNKRG